MRQDIFYISISQESFNLKIVERERSNVEEPHPVGTLTHFSIKLNFQEFQ